MSIQSEIDRINQNVENTYRVLEELGADMPETQNTDNLADTVLSIKAVRYDAQTLTEDQKAQARTNIGAAKGFMRVTKAEYDAMTFHDPTTLYLIIE